MYVTYRSKQIYKNISVQCKRRLDFLKVVDVIQDTQKVAYFVFKDCSSPVKTSNFNPLNPDLLTLYRRPKPIKIWLNYAVPPTTPAQHTTWVERDHPFFQPVEKLIPLTTTSQSGSDHPQLYFRPTYALPDQGPLMADPFIFFRAGKGGGVIGSLVWAGL